ncbi:MAG: HDOD domain-containing protein [bacterium]|nr:HDOD domain-containing protein [bacterium]
MASVLVVTGDSCEIERIQACLEPSHTVHGITTPAEVNLHLPSSEIVLLDHAFTDNNGIDTLMEIMTETQVPVLFLSPPDDPQCATEAVRLGAFNYGVKTEHYHALLLPAIRDMLDRSTRQQATQHTITELEQRIAELEAELLALRQYITSQNLSSAIGTQKRILKTITARIKAGEVNLPVYPPIPAQFRALLKDDPPMAEIADFLKQDMSITTKLISVSNSVYYRGATENKTLERAIARLGLEVTTQYVEILANRSLYTINNPTYQMLLQPLWDHALACAHAAQQTAILLDLAAPEELFTMGLLHDIGRLLLIQMLAELDLQGTFELEFSDVSAILDTQHATFGRNLLRQWEFPSDFADICLYHARLEDAAMTSEQLLVVHFANMLVRTTGYGQELPADIEIADIVSVPLLKLTPTMIASVKDEVTAIMQGCDLGFM